METENSKKRAPNYSHPEKELLLNIIESFKETIENKKTDGVSVHEKKEAWRKICEKFNAASPNLHYRPAESLKKYYDKLKEDLRKRCALKKKELYKTGGGPELNRKDEMGDEFLMSIINKKTVVGLNSQFDCDSEPASEVTSEPTNKESQQETETQAESDTNVFEIVYESEEQNGDLGLNGRLETQNAGDWKKPENLKRPISAILQNNVQKTCSIPANKKKSQITSRRRPNTVLTLTSSRLGEKYEVLIEKKLELLECLKKEHLLRMKSLELDVALKKRQLSSKNPTDSKLSDGLTGSQIMDL